MGSLENATQSAERKSRSVTRTCTLSKSFDLCVDRAVAFSLRPNSQLALTAIQRWMRVYETHKNAQSFAVQYDTAQVRYKTTLYWRLLLRKKLKTAKTARLAARYFAVRRAWKVWKDRLEELRRQQQLKQILIAKKKAVFDGASRIIILKSLLI